jgi:hypothetical protein
MKNVTVEWLTRRGACVTLEDKRRAEKLGDLRKIINELIKENRLDDANWLITRYMPTKRQKVSYAIYAANQVLWVYEKEYPNDSRPRDAIEAAKRWLKNPTKRNSEAAEAAAEAAGTAVRAVADAKGFAVAYAAGFAAAAARAAGYAAVYAAGAAEAAAVYAAYAVAYATAAAATYAAARDAMKIKIIKYGLKLIYKDNK